MADHPIFTRDIPDEGNGTWIEKPVKEIGNQRYLRYVVRSHLVKPGEDLMKTLVPYFQGKVTPKDIVVIGEKVVAIAEGRAVLLSHVKPRWAARFLSRHVRQLGYGLGLRRPETMEMAIREVGLARILLAAGVGACDRVLGRSGDFYRVAGRQVASIDGPGPTTIPPYNQYIVLAPRSGQTLADKLAKALHTQVAIVDVNDIGAEVLAASAHVDMNLVRELLRDNPMGQGAQRTPLAVLRPTTQEKRLKNWPSPGGSSLNVQGGFVATMPGEGTDAVIWAGDEVASTRSKS
ncbi:coenzyme F420-0:L-glutamate ligase [Sulfobacillus thermosulfidooxidans]|uniref:F420-0:Gamma-glutamyl ligase n=1 Tax=Sulfobacillus thermosulfidooxidans (strain DSM 9293 / VKM B-1269 / AT-1) TaxID=929705 RepID=A0A1W1W7X0_SULTA|nr:coenzyme F420-0:L-glutamate ligase [Sulfobacillus thermosulfidooxidans]OLZ10570.1 hypothetical protein BFX05_01710 [Sulfobacillus thermosulfidooxidans]OLZ16807.1 hypothetical protein BFX06_14445 [Sulfobacillus thermosulfidooxidans]OLZ22247.1 hypothetical protein BFX07_10325 [Sulfobacillus thermosulfidooxidans]SMC02292.1 F420-0:Gamma-glutamyl ligase [Sulfobacillus thermosulfidooxidans DSM 9293]